MAVRIGKLLGLNVLVGTVDNDLLIALGAATLDGGAGNDILLGGWNNDTLIGGAGADLLSGGLGTDTADYSGSSAAVTVNLTTGKGFGGDAEGDRLLSIENAIGSAHADTLTGNNGNNVLTGGTGADTFVVTKGNDVIMDFTPGTPATPTTEMLWDFQSPHPISIGTGSIVAAAPDYVALQDGPGDLVAADTFGGIRILSTAGGFDLVSLEVNAPRLLGTNDDYIYIAAINESNQEIGSITVYSPSGRVTVNFESQTFSGGTAPYGFEGSFTAAAGVTGVKAIATDRVVAFDDIRVRFPGTLGVPGDKIDVPVGTDIDALVASAASNGHGGTILSHAQGTLELLGVPPASVSADWFV